MPNLRAFGSFLVGATASTAEQSGKDGGEEPRTRCRSMDTTLGSVIISIAAQWIPTTRQLGIARPFFKGTGHVARAAAHGYKISL